MGEASAIGTGLIGIAPVLHDTFSFFLDAVVEPTVLVVDECLVVDARLMSSWLICCGCGLVGCIVRLVPLPFGPRVRLLRSACVGRLVG